MRWISDSLSVPTGHWIIIWRCIGSKNTLWSSLYLRSLSSSLLWSSSSSPVLTSRICSGSSSFEWQSDRMDPSWDQVSLSLSPSPSPSSLSLSLSLFLSLALSVLTFHQGRQQHVCHPWFCYDFFWNIKNKSSLLVEQSFPILNFFSCPTSCIKWSVIWLNYIRLRQVFLHSLSLSLWFPTHSLPLTSVSHHSLILQHDLGSGKENETRQCSLFFLIKRKRPEAREGMLMWRGVKVKRNRRT